MAAPVRTFPPIPYGMADFHAMRLGGRVRTWGGEAVVLYCCVGHLVGNGRLFGSDPRREQSRLPRLERASRVVVEVRRLGAAAATHSRGAR